MKTIISSIVLAVVLMLPVQPANAGTDAYIGEIMWTAATFCPRATLEANGQLLAISSNTALFSLLGTTYGGDGRTTFALPDLRGRAALHTGTGPGLTPRPAGQRGGRETETLTVPQMPSHQHGLDAATVTLHASNQPGETPSADGAMLADGQRAAVYAPAPASPADVVNMAAESVSLTGNTNFVGANQSHNNMPPYAVVRACVVTQGIFPSRS